MQRFSGYPLSLLLALSLALTACKREPQTAPALPAAPAPTPEALPATPEVFPPAPCDETNALLRRPAAAPGSSVDLVLLTDLINTPGEVSVEAAAKLKAAGPAAAPLADLVASRIVAANPEESARLLDALASISPEAVVTVASKLIDTGAAEPSRLKLSLAASSLISVGEQGFIAFLERAKNEALITPPIRISRMERMSSYPLPAYELLFGNERFCSKNPNDAGCRALLRELLIARPALIPPSDQDSDQVRLLRTEAALLRGEPAAAAAWNQLLLDKQLTPEARMNSFEFVNHFLPAAVAIPAALSLFREPLPLRSERAIALWLIARSGALRDPAILAQLDAPLTETPDHLVARALVRLFAGDPALATASAEQLRIFGASQRNDLAALAQLALLKLGKFSLLTHTSLTKQADAWTALMAAKDAAAMMALRDGALKETSEVMRADAATLWAVGREQELALHLATVTEPAARPDALLLADRLGAAGATVVASHLSATPDLDAANAVAALTTSLTADQAKPWIEAAVANPRYEIAALKLAARYGYLLRQENLIPILLRDRDGRKPGVIRQVDATRFAQILLIRQPQLSRERLAASRRQLAPSDAGFAAIGLVLFAATTDCAPSTE
ncbi:MAG: hypothetical protein HQ461_02360 [Deltaproteobacteria bacterium]|nr:hypothetical protein [Deltaproteobacteria bacterium]